MYGELNEKDELDVEYYFPYISNDTVTSKAECSIQRHAEKETYAGLLDEYKVGISLIFYLLNPMEYRERTQKTNSPVKGGIGQPVSAVRFMERFFFQLKKQPCR